MEIRIPWNEFGPRIKGIKGLPDGKYKFRIEVVGEDFTAVLTPYPTN